ncbi:MAG: DUF3376 domain-containing protein, partial [Gammaproteobacteria bacterium]|nr:DUF3376 domain-containing protein [Gammaproteobacteria bacterium]
PFSGERFMQMLFDAMLSMGELSNHRSLLPNNQPLKLHITLTDFFGYGRDVKLFDPAVITEREHRHVMEFTFLDKKTGQVESHFSNEHIASLAFAARGTSSYVGLFDPLSLDELKRVAHSRGLPIDTAIDFIAAQLTQGSVADLAQRTFIDGGVLNNKPFAAAIEAIQGRAASRQVDRRLIYIEPRPTAAEPIAREQHAAPSYLGAIRHALSLPRHEPIRDELERLGERNQRTGSIRTIIERARPQVRASVKHLLGTTPIEDAQAAMIGSWREVCDAAAEHESGFAYATYRDLRIRSLAETLRDAHPTIANCETQLGDWLLGSKSSAQYALMSIDTEYRRRRIQFLILRINELYRVSLNRSRRGALDSLKFALYACIEEIGDIARRNVELDANDPASVWVEQLRGSDELAALDAKLDGLCAVMCSSDATESIRSEILYAYLGFPYFDVLTYPAAQWANLVELDEVKVIRISPSDANSIRAGDASTSLRGIELNGFGAFFSREYRENDYLWGRLHAGERLIDLVAATTDNPEALDIPALKRRLFTAILDEEDQHLTAIPSERAAIRKRLTRI